MFRKILVPIDGSETSNLGLREAIELAKNQNATLLLLHVVDELTIAQICANAYVPMNNVEEFLDGLMEGGRKLLEEAKARVREQGLTSESALTTTMGRRVADVILDKAREWQADLVVLGTHGRRGWNRRGLRSRMRTNAINNNKFLLPTRNAR